MYIRAVLCTSGQNCVCDDGALSVSAVLCIGAVLCVCQGSVGCLSGQNYVLVMAGLCLPGFWQISGRVSMKFELQCQSEEK